MKFFASLIIFLIITKLYDFSFHFSSFLRSFSSSLFNDNEWSNMLAYLRNVDMVPMATISAHMYEHLAYLSRKWMSLRMKDNDVIHTCSYHRIVSIELCSSTCAWRWVVKINADNLKDGDKFSKICTGTPIETLYALLALPTKPLPSHMCRLTISEK